MVLPSPVGESVAANFLLSSPRPNAFTSASPGALRVYIPNMLPRRITLATLTVTFAQRKNMG